MIIDRDTLKFIVFSEETIINALQKISSNKLRVVFAVSEVGVLEGVITDGDFRRWLLQKNDVNLHKPVSELMNTYFTFYREESDPSEIVHLFSEKINHIPIVDKHNRLVGVALPKSKRLTIKDFVISESSPCFIIAEIGNNHNGSILRAKELVDQAIAAGADCVKFQMRSLDGLYRNQSLSEGGSNDLGTEYVLDLLFKYQLTDDEMFEMFRYCEDNKIIPLCTPWDEPSLEKINSYGLSAIKVASADLTNHDFIEQIIKIKKPILCSVGMSTEQEIKSTVQLLQKRGAQYVLLHCNSTYPAPYKDINLQYIERLQEIGDCLVGYSGHEQGISVPVAAVALGAKIIEKHFTLDRTLEGNDHKVSLLPSEFKEMVTQIRQVEESLGDKGKKTISQGELINRENLAKSLVAGVDIKKGDVISAKSLSIRSPGHGLPPYKKNALVGLKAIRDIAMGEFFYNSDIENNFIQPRKYKFPLSWGVPVRFFDVSEFCNKVNPQLVEFHLSYKDLDLEPDLKKNFDVDFLVHCPELFKGDHLLDLCAKDDNYRRHSIEEMQRVIDLTNDLKRFYPKTEQPLIIVNVGGFTQNRHLPETERGCLYDLFLNSLNQLDLKGVELIIQTMPPFPWHFGGRSYHNLFVSPYEISSICQKNNLRICFDISHSHLACNYYGWSIKEFIEIVSPFIAHIHIADAKDIDGEGLQIGDGIIDFYTILMSLVKHAPRASFIPEIWQGHKNGGAGFWEALNKLDDIFYSIMKKGGTTQKS